MKHRFLFVASALCALSSIASMASAQTNSTGSGQVTFVPAPKRFSVVIDAGHGGADVGEGEKNINLAVAFELRSELEKQGVQVIMTRTRDEFISLQDRVAIVDKFNPDCFVSIHGLDPIHYGSMANAYFYTVTYAQPESKELANMLDNRLTKVLKPQSRRKVEQARFYVLRNPSVPAVMVTGNVVSLANSETQHDVAVAIARGLRDYAVAKAASTSSAPVLKDIPGIGKLFNGRSSSSAPKPEDKTSPMQRKPESRYQYLGSKLSK